METIENIDYNYDIYTQIENLKIIKEWISDIDILLKRIEKIDINNIQKQIEEVYQRGIEDGQNETWEATKKMLCMSTERIEECFDVDESTIWLFYHMNVAEAIAKLKAYEEKQKADEDVKRGDVVRHKTNGLTYIVTLASECGYVLLDIDGNFATSCITNSFEKTGKHVDIDKILEEMKE